MWTTKHIGIELHMTTTTLTIVIDTLSMSSMHEIDDRNDICSQSIILLTGFARFAEGFGFLFLQFLIPSPHHHQFYLDTY